MEKNKRNLKNNTPKNNKDKPTDNFDWKRASKTSFVWLAIIFGAVYISGLLTEVGKKEVEIEISESVSFLTIVESWHVLRSQCEEYGLKEAVEKVDEVFPLLNTEES